MPIQKRLTGREVLARMRKGDLPHIRGGYLLSSAFDDGALVSHKTMYQLWRNGLITMPVGTSISATWTLKKI